MKLYATKPLATLFVALGFSLVGCSYFEAPQAPQGSQSFSSTDEDRIIAGKPTVGVLNSRRVLKGMQACLGLTEVSGAAKKLWLEKRGSLSVNGQSETITAPTLMAHAELAGELCHQLVTEEKSRPAIERRIFRHVDFSASYSDHSEREISDVIRRLARSCWGRNESGSERDTILDELNRNFDEERQVESALVFSCSAMMASLSGTSH